MDIDPFWLGATARRLATLFGHLSLFAAQFFDVKRNSCFATDYNKAI
jgi:hypothetical protein